MTLKTIVAKLGGEHYEGGRRANIPAPGHSAKDRSVSLMLVGDRVIVHTFNGVDWREVLDDLRRQGLIDARNAPLSVPGATQAISAVIHTPDRDRLAAAKRIWDGGRAVRRTLSERHLRFVLIAADRGKDGEASADLWRRRSVGSSIWLPPEPHRDWNEAASPSGRSGLWLPGQC